MNYEPKTFDEFIGQDYVKRELMAMIVAQDNSSILIRGNFGSGKTTLAKIFASWDDTGFTYQDTPQIIQVKNKNVNTHIIDEIHLAKEFEYFYDDMGKYRMIFCTTERSSLPAPFVSRCVELVLGDYSNNELYTILRQKADKDGIEVAGASLINIACRSRGTPRIAIRLLQRLKNLSIFDDKFLHADYVINQLESLKVFSNGLIEDDIKYLNMLNESNSAISIATLSSMLNRHKSYIEDNIESFLLYRGFISITPRGRIITALGRKELTDV